MVVKIKLLNIILETGGVLKEISNNKYRILSEEEQEAKTEYQRK